MNFDNFKKASNAGGELLARQAWDAAVSVIKAALPDHVTTIDAAVAPELVQITSTDSGVAAEGN